MGLTMTRGGRSTAEEVWEDGGPGRDQAGVPSMQTGAGVGVSPLEQAAGLALPNPENN